MKFFRKLFGGRRESKVRSNWAPFKFPGDILKPEAVGVFASPDVSGSWSAIYMTRALQESFPNLPVHLVIRKDYAQLAEFLPWLPEIHMWGSDSSVTEPQIEPGVLMFASEPCDDLLRFVEKCTPRACVSVSAHSAVNIHVKTEGDPFPDAVRTMTGILGLKYPEDWKPEPPQVLSEKASSILSPISHKTLPYILATEAAASILDRKKAEIPLKIVLADGKASSIPPETDHSLFAAVVSGASAVVTTDRYLWVHSRALGVPVVGLDRKGVFQGWGGEPAGGESQFLEQWASLIRRGW
ncbi:hypothetical protein CSA37_04870 [Candidatus Fermentibacteria bacterium]|nr:MAG: hypothetical protein CSA37_10160 [Candidatus Fermentibacteria bacterium]PIE52261.1 MAG: hypothetical protein CSA37_07265 [Candidatus Fermentibacteria bacterium]PIE52756.1 MAG: hypothetical protein CSA37_04870 [Candidatus Fermentibacteria bacterium]